MSSNEPLQAERWHKDVRREFILFSDALNGLPLIGTLER